MTKSRIVSLLSFRDFGSKLLELYSVPATHLFLCISFRERIRALQMPQLP